MQHGYKSTLFFLPADGETIWIVTLSLISFKQAAARKHLHSQNEKSGAENQH